MHQDFAPRTRTDSRMQHQTRPLLAGRSALAAFFVAAVATFPTTASADSTAVIRAALHGASLDTFRVVSSQGGVIKDVTSSGLKVGVAGTEERLALVRPIMLDEVSPFVNYQVVSVSLIPSQVNASFFIPPRIWDATTTPAQIFAMKSQNPQPVT